MATRNMKWIEPENLKGTKGTLTNPTTTLPTLSQRHIRSLMIQITSFAIDTDAVLRSVSSPNCGAAVLFVGTTRQFTNERETKTLAYECYQPMALAKMKELQESALAKWNIEHCSIVHRIGVVDVEAASVVVAVSSPHRVASFESASWIMERLKQVVPIWKQEHWAGGDTEWVHPQTPPAETEVTS